MVEELNAETFKRATHNVSLSIFVMFYSPMCSACDSLARDFEAVSATFRSHTDILIARLDADSFPEEAAKYTSFGIPSLVSRRAQSYRTHFSSSCTKLDRGFSLIKSSGLALLCQLAYRVVECKSKSPRPTSFQIGLFLSKLKI